MNWRQTAKWLFFSCGLRVGEISARVNMPRETVSRYVTKLSGYKEEMSRRKASAVIGRRAYKTEWARERRAKPLCGGEPTKDTIMREHIAAARTLSAERF